MGSNVCDSTPEGTYLTSKLQTAPHLVGFKTTIQVCWCQLHSNIII